MEKFVTLTEQSIANSKATVVSRRFMRAIVAMSAQFFASVAMATAAVDVRDHGAICNGLVDDTAAFVSANTTAGVDDTIDVPAALGVCSIGEDLIFEAALTIGSGSRLRPATDVMVTIGGPIDAPETAVIFDLTENGKFRIRSTQELYSNWFSGGDSGDQWNNMKASIPDVSSNEFGPIKIKLVGKHRQVTPMDWTSVRPSSSVVLDFTASSILCATDGTPCLDLTDSRQTKILGGTIRGDSEDSPNVGYLVSRNIDHRASGGFRVFAPEFSGVFKIAPLYVNGANTNNFIGGRYRNDGGKYGVWLGVGNEEDVVSPFLGDISSTPRQADGNYFIGVEIANRGNTGRRVATFKNHGATKSGIFASQIVNTNLSIPDVPILLIDSSVNGVNGFIMRDVRWAAGPGADAHAVRIETSSPGNEFIGIRWEPSTEQGRSTVESRATEISVGSGARLESCTFLLLNGDDFDASQANELRDCTIEARRLSDPAAAPRIGRITLGDFFSGTIRMSDPDRHLAIAGTMNGEVFDIDADTVRLYSDLSGEEPQGLFRGVYDGVEKHLVDGRFTALFDMDLSFTDGAVFGGGEIAYVIHATNGPLQCIQAGTAVFGGSRAENGAVGEIITQAEAVGEPATTCSGNETMSVDWSSFPAGGDARVRVRSNASFDPTIHRIRYSLTPLSPVRISLR